MYSGGKSTYDVRHGGLRHARQYSRDKRRGEDIRGLTHVVIPARISVWDTRDEVDIWRERKGG